jgi:hypothetical protein
MRRECYVSVTNSEVSHPVNLGTFGAYFINTGLQPGVKAAAIYKPF